MIEYLILGILLTAAYIYYSFIYRPKKQFDYYINTLESLGYKVRKLPFKPFKVPLVQTWKQCFTKYNDAYYLDKRQTQRYDFQVHNVMNFILVDIINPDMMRQFLSMQKIFIFPKTKNYIANMIRLLGNGVAFSEDQAWKTKRKIITSVFNFDFLKSIIPKISQICDQQFDKMETKLKIPENQHDSIKVFLLETGFNIFSSILMVSFFGMDSNKCTIQGKTPCEFITSALSLVNQQSRDLLGFLLGSWIFNLGLKQKDRKVNHTIKAFRQFATNLVKQKIQTIQANKIESKSNYNDLIEALVYHYNLGSQQKQNSNQKYSINDVIDQFCTLLAAATDTTSHFFMMIVYYIVETPSVQKRLREEIDQIFKTEDDMNYENLKKLKYIDCIQEQITRIYGPGTGVFLRQATKDTLILNVPIKKGTSFSIKPFLNHMSPQIFEQPLKFMPQRWQQPINVHPYTIMGFSGGPRGCLGKHLAMLQTKIALIKMFKRYSSIQLQTHIQDWRMNIHFLYGPQKFMTFFKK